MVRYDDPVVVYLAQGPHHLVHVLIAVVDEGFAPGLGHGVGNVAEVDLEELVNAAEVADRLDDTDSHTCFAALEPAANAQANANIGAVGDLQGALVARESAEDTAGDAAESVDRRVVRVDTDIDSFAFGDRGDRYGSRVPSARGRVSVVFPCSSEKSCLGLGKVSLCGRTAVITTLKSFPTGSRGDSPSQNRRSGTYPHRHSPSSGAKHAYMFTM